MYSLHTYSERELECSSYLMNVSYNKADSPYFTHNFITSSCQRQSSWLGYLTDNVFRRQDLRERAGRLHDREGIEVSFQEHGPIPLEPILRYEYSREPRGENWNIY
ncbi:hypothetical protein J6590_038215 [Homalodisca vitripennis]|nr:hypothetical protein J6590_038215 [Homalodisca vitripennis]